MPDSAAIARKRISDAIELLSVCAADKQDIILAVGEAITNAIRHGCGCDPSLEVCVKCNAGPDRVVVCIVDPGKGFDPGSVPPPETASMVGGGMGIYIMRELMDKVEYNFDGCTKLTLVKHFIQPAGLD